jgi:hypothetical protein
LGPTLEAKEKYGVDQVLFCPDGDVQETGAANFLLISDDEILTKSLDTSFLHGMTRDSILKLGAELGYKISERPFTVEELLEPACPARRRRCHRSVHSSTTARKSRYAMVSRVRIARNCRKRCRIFNTDWQPIRTAG